MRKKTNKLVILLIILFVVVVLSTIFLFMFTIKPVSNNPEESFEFTVKENSTGKSVLDDLDKYNLIKNSDIVYLYAKVTNKALDFKAGTYLLMPSWDANHIIEYISNSENALEDVVRIRFLEGSRVKDFAKVLSDKTSLEYDELINYWNDENTVRSYMNDYQFLTEEIFNENVKSYLEGYLFPDTYDFYRVTTKEDVTKKLLNRTLEIYNEYFDDINNNDLSTHQLFTMASIIQRETGSVDDMPIVSSVFYNRLSIGMMLQSSVTVCYALDIGLNDSDWAKCEITQDENDPYNTYQNGGLPPGPICNFSKKALYAAIHPEETDYFFFIGDVCGSGKTYFAKTYDEQLANQERYLTCF